MPKAALSIVYGLGDSAPESIAEQLMLITSTSHFSLGFNSPLRAISIVLSKPLLPKVIRFIDKRRNSTGFDFDFDFDLRELISAIGGVADDAQTAAWLLGSATTGHPIVARTMIGDEASPPSASAPESASSPTAGCSRSVSGS